MIHLRKGTALFVVFMFAFTSMYSLLGLVKFLVNLILQVILNSSITYNQYVEPVVIFVQICLSWVIGIWITGRAVDSIIEFSSP